MSRSPYSSYHGRSRHGRSVLIGVAAALVILLAAVLAGYYLGLFNVPADTDRSPADAPATQQAQPSREPVVIVEVPSAAPSPVPTPETADLSGHTVRDIPLGLVLAAPDALPETSKNGVLVDMTGADLSALGEDFSEKLSALPYAAAWVDTADNATTLAALGFDEIVLAATVPEGDGADLAKTYRDLRAQLDKVGWQGRLGLDVDQSLFASRYDDDLVPAMAQSFQRLYFRKTLDGGNKQALVNGGFAATGMTIVTAVKQASSLTYAWAVLP